MAPTVLDGFGFGSLLGDLVDRAGGAGGATGGALIGGVTFEADVGAGLIEAGAALYRILVGGAGGVFGGVTGALTGAGGGCGVRVAGSLLLARLAERDLCSPTFREGISPQRRSTILSLATFCPGIVAVFFISFIFLYPAFSSPIFGFLRPRFGYKHVGLPTRWKQNKIRLLGHIFSLIATRPHERSPL